MFVTIFTFKRCSVRLYLQLFVGGLMSYLRYLCLFSHGGVQRILCCFFLRVSYIASFSEFFYSFFGIGTDNLDPAIFNKPSIVQCNHVSFVLKITAEYKTVHDNRHSGHFLFNHVVFFFVFNNLRWEVVVHFVLKHRQIYDIKLISDSL